jgi:hypothetical protein
VAHQRRVLACIFGIFIPEFAEKCIFISQIALL